MLAVTVSSLSYAQSADAALRDQHIPVGSKKNPAPVSSGVMMGYVVRRVMPDYPALRCGSHLRSGTSVMRLVINPDGKIKRLEWVFGSPDYRKPVMDAVRRWTYKPYLLNGKAVWVKTTVTLGVDRGCAP